MSAPPRARTPPDGAHGVTRSKLRRRLLVALSAVVVVFLALSLRLFVWPTTHDASRADVVLVLDGGDGERLRKERELMARDAAPILAVSAGRELEPDEAGGLCSEPQRFEVVCFVPTSDSTRGEARAFAKLAQQNGWEDVALVTSTYHVTRARMLIERCFDGRLRAVTASPGRDPLHWAARIGHEWLGTIDATVRRSC